jgi:hypothetical protein
LLAILLILWGISLLGVIALSSVLLGILAIITGLLLLFERYVPVHRHVA